MQRCNDVQEQVQSVQDPLDEHGQAWHAPQCAQRGEGAECAQARVLPSDGNSVGIHNEVELAPRVAQVRLAREEEAIGEDLGGELGGEVGVTRSHSAITCAFHVPGGSSGESHAIMPQLARIVKRMSGSKKDASIRRMAYLHGNLPTRRQLVDVPAYARLPVPCTSRTREPCAPGSATTGSDWYRRATALRFLQQASARLTTRLAMGETRLPMLTRSSISTSCHSLDDLHGPCHRHSSRLHARQGT